MSANEANPAVVFQKIQDYLSWIEGGLENVQFKSKQLDMIIGSI